LQKLCANVTVRLRNVAKGETTNKAKSLMAKFGKVQYICTSRAVLLATQILKPVS